MIIIIIPVSVDDLKISLEASNNFQVKKILCYVSELNPWKSGHKAAICSSISSNLFALDAPHKQ